MRGVGVRDGCPKEWRPVCGGLAGDELKKPGTSGPERRRSRDGSGIIPPHIALTILAPTVEGILAATQFPTEATS